jgi:hypothetical protein
MTRASQQSRINGTKSGVGELPVISQNGPSIDRMP